MRAEIAHTFIALASLIASRAAASCSAAAASTRPSFIWSFDYRSGGITPDARLKAALNLLLGERLKIEE
jgi:hypothetical protein